MEKCIKCGSDGAKTLFSAGKNCGELCFRCARCIDASVGDQDHSNPRYSDSMYTRELYHRLMSAPNTKWRGY